jgi:hypothetical protein
MVKCSEARSPAWALAQLPTLTGAVAAALVMRTAQPAPESSSFETHGAASGASALRVYSPTAAVLSSASTDNGDATQGTGGRSVEAEPRFVIKQALIQRVRTTAVARYRAS